VRASRWEAGPRPPIPAALFLLEYSAGTYPSITASFPGYTSATVNSLVVNEGSITHKTSR